MVELHAYALVDQPAEDQLKDQLSGRAAPDLSRARAGAASLRRSGLINDDCPLPGTGPWAPAASPSHTPHPRIVLAGDGIRCDFPVALMERAATTGFLAANQLLSSWNVAGHDLWTVPMRSRHRLAVSMHALVAR